MTFMFLRNSTAHTPSGAYLLSSRTGKAGWGEELLGRTAGSPGSHGDQQAHWQSLPLLLPCVPLALLTLDIEHVQLFRKVATGLGQAMDS